MRVKPESSRTLSATMRTSVASSRFMPAPTAEPRTAEMVGALSEPARTKAW